MGVRVVIAGAVSAVILFVWGFLYWNVLATMISPWNAISPDADASVIGTLKTAFPESGVYMYPWVDASGGDRPGLEDEFQKQHEEGPLVQVFYHMEGIPPSAMGMTMLQGFIHMFIAATICALLLSMAEPLGSYRARVGFVFLLGLFTAFWIHGADAIWWHHPLSHCLFMAAYSLGAWLLVALVMAKMIVQKTREPEAATATDS